MEVRQCGRRSDCGGGGPPVEVEVRPLRLHIKSKIEYIIILEKYDKYQVQKPQVPNTSKFKNFKAPKPAKNLQMPKVSKNNHRSKKI